MSGRRRDRRSRASTVVDHRTGASTVVRSTVDAPGRRSAVLRAVPGRRIGLDTGRDVRRRRPVPDSGVHLPRCCPHRRSRSARPGAGVPVRAVPGAPASRAAVIGGVRGHRGGRGRLLGHLRSGSRQPWWSAPRSSSPRPGYPGVSAAVAAARLPGRGLHRDHERRRRGRRRVDHGRRLRARLRARPDPADAERRHATEHRQREHAGGRDEYDPPGARRRRGRHLERARLLRRPGHREHLRARRGGGRPSRPRAAGFPAPSGQPATSAAAVGRGDGETPMADAARRSPGRTVGRSRGSPGTDRVAGRGSRPGGTRHHHRRSGGARSVRGSGGPATGADGGRRAGRATRGQHRRAGRHHPDRVGHDRHVAPELLGQQLRHERDPHRAADQHQRGQVRGARPGSVERAAHGLDGLGRGWGGSSPRTPRARAAPGCAGRAAPPG